MAPLRFCLVSYLAFAELGHLLQVAGAPMATLWPPSGFYLAALLLAPRRWPVSALAALAANFASDVLLHGTAPLTSIGFCVANAAEALVGAWLARRLSASSEAASSAGFHNRMRGALALLAGAVLAGPALGASIGAGLMHEVADAPFGQTWALWCVGDALGALVVTPILLGAENPPRSRAAAAAECAAVALAGAALVTISLFLMPAANRGGRRRPCPELHVGRLNSVRGA